jgi:hypothetical protein
MILRPAVHAAMPRAVARATRTFFDVPVRSSWPLLMSTVFSLYRIGSEEYKLQQFCGRTASRTPANVGHYKIHVAQHQRENRLIRFGSN